MKKPIIVISSHVVRGSVGNRAAVFALEVLGHPVWAVPTIILPYHPGHGPGTRIVPDEEQFESVLDDLGNSPWIGEVGAVLSGYMANAYQAEAVLRFVTQLKAANPEIVYTCDPVIGDEGRLYVPEEVAKAIGNYLIPQADIITPNRFELGWLSRAAIDDFTAARQAAKKLGVPIALVTSMPGMIRGNIANMLIKNNNGLLAEHRQLSNPPNGPGDLTAALFLSHHLSGDCMEANLKLVTASVFEIVAGAAKRGADELMLESDAQSIRTPMAMVSVRKML